MRWRRSARNGGHHENHLARWRSYHGSRGTWARSRRGRRRGVGGRELTPREHGGHLRQKHRSGGPRPVRSRGNPRNNTVYVTNSQAGTVSVINGATNTVEATIPVGSDPTAVAADPRTNLIYVTNSDSGTVSVINGTTNTVVAIMG